jgi:hypothetical protein
MTITKHIQEGLQQVTLQRPRDCACYSLSNGFTGTPPLQPICGQFWGVGRSGR